jgi:hypothetical protein
VQQFKEAIRDEQQSCVDRDAETERLNTRIAALREETERLQDAVQCNYTENMKHYREMSAFVCDSILGPVEEAPQEKSNDNEAESEDEYWS